MEEAIRNLDETGFKIALVITDDRRLLGTISDGDIRRGLLRGLRLEDSIESLVTQKPLVVAPEIERGVVLNLMRANAITQIPIVDENRRVIGLHLWEDIGKSLIRNNTMVVMAGGLGTRLRPYTEKCPKPLLPVAGKPMLEHIVERAKAEGFVRFTLAIHYLGSMIENHFGSGKKWQVQIDYLKEESPLGTAGALSLFKPESREPIIVTNGDVLTDIRYGELLDYHKAQQAVATMAVHMHEWQHPFGVVHTKGVDITRFEEKPISKTLINAGIYVLNTEALRYLNENEPCDMPALFERLLKANKRAVVYPMHEPWLDVGRKVDFELANSDNPK